jgi:hypothetical protein
MPTRPTPRSLSPTPADSAPADAYRLGRWFAGVRRSGLLAALSPQAWHTLGALLSFTSREGTRHFTLEQLALALGLPRDAAQARLAGLAQTTWQGGPLLRLEHSAAGEVAGAELAPLELLEQVAVPATIAPTADPATAPITPTPAADLPGALAAAGLNPGQVERLLESYSPERIQRQLGWLPARRARNPAALLVRAIEGDWEAPQGPEAAEEAR